MAKKEKKEPEPIPIPIPSEPVNCPTCELNAERISRGEGLLLHTH
jgi:hypothetical protein